ncbi:CBM96 family carbohydrate-binding protein [Micromonospora schwarzwaldensis]|uniref:CBM96 family carbohydrate-binding protein n=1 Tax=Micromonospora sp. DSM 45708 TaxID=3111767 RepID=UPI0031CE5F16
MTARSRSPLRHLAPALVLAVVAVASPAAAAPARATAKPHATTAAQVARAAAAVTLTPVADAWVDASHPTVNAGRTASLRVDAVPRQVAYLRFEVTDVDTDPTAVLRLYVETASSTGVDVHPVADSAWDESTITDDNAPPIGATVVRSGPVGADTWVSVNVSSLVTGNGPVTVALTTTNDTGLRVTSREGTNKPQLLTPAPPDPSPYVVTRTGPTTYRAASDVTGETYTGSLKTVLESAVVELNRLGGGVVRFDAGTFDFGAEYLKLEGIRRVTFVGAGMYDTLIRNDNSTAGDTEPFNTKGWDGVIVRDLAVSAGGAARSTSDALDFDDGNNMVVERVRVTASRGRGIVFDGKNQTWTSMGNTVRDCVISGAQSDGVELLATSGDTVTGCTISDVGGHGIQVNRASSTADQPNKTADHNIISDNVIDQAGQDGININSGTDNRVVDNHVTDSSDDTANRDGIRVTTATGITCVDTVVSGNVAVDDQTVRTQRYGLYVTEGCDATVVGPGNTFTPNRVSAVRDAGNGTIFR